jgi:hypothetical protein
VLSCMSILICWCISSLNSAVDADTIWKSGWHAFLTSWIPLSSVCLQ